MTKRKGYPIRIFIILVLSGECLSSIGTKYSLYLDEVTWFQARQRCKETVGILATVSDPNVYELMEYMDNGAIPGEFWIGYSRHNESAEWTWQTDLQSNWTDWGGEENLTEGNCALVPTDSYNWVTENCDNFHSYLCQEDKITPKMKISHYTLHTEDMTWFDASEKCAETNRILATVYDPSVLMELNYNQLHVSAFWIGYYRPSKTAEWKWQNAEQGREWENWKDDKSPTNGSCTSVLNDAGKEYKWIAVDCTTKQPFLCEEITEESCSFPTYKDVRISEGGTRKLRRSSVGECSVACLKETAFHCLSFDYNSLHQDCRLNDINQKISGLQHLLRATDWTHGHKICSYEKSCSFHFSYNVTIWWHNSKVLTVSTIEGCQTACLEETMFYCVSFNYDSVNTECHLNDVSEQIKGWNKVKDVPRWIHGSRVCIYGDVMYTKTENVTIETSTESTYTESNQETTSAFSKIPDTNELVSTGTTTNFGTSSIFSMMSSWNADETTVTTTSSLVDSGGISDIVITPSNTYQIQTSTLYQEEVESVEISKFSSIMSIQDTEGATSFRAEGGLSSRPLSSYIEDMPNTFSHSSTILIMSTSERIEVVPSERPSAFVSVTEHLSSTFFPTGVISTTSNSENKMAVSSEKSNSSFSSVGEVDAETTHISSSTDNYLLTSTEEVILSSSQSEISFPSTDDLMSTAPEQPLISETNNSTSIINILPTSPLVLQSSTSEMLSDSGNMTLVACGCTETVTVSVTISASIEASSDNRMSCSFALFEPSDTETTIPSLIVPLSERLKTLKAFTTRAKENNLRLRRTSAENLKPHSKYMGYTSMAFIFSVLGLILISDLSTLPRDIKRIKRRLGFRSKKKKPKSKIRSLEDGLDYLGYNSQARKDNGVVVVHRDAENEQFLEQLNQKIRDLKNDVTPRQHRRRRQRTGGTDDECMLPYSGSHTPNDEISNAGSDTLEKTSLNVSTVTEANGFAVNYSTYPTSKPVITHPTSTHVITHPTSNHVITDVKFDSTHVKKNDTPVTPTQFEEQSKFTPAAAETENDDGAVEEDFSGKYVVNSQAIGDRIEVPLFSRDIDRGGNSHGSVAAPPLTNEEKEGTAEKGDLPVLINEVTIDVGLEDRIGGYTVNPSF